MSQLRKKGPEIILYPEEKYVYQQLFQVADEEKKGYIKGIRATNFLRKSNLPLSTLSKIWDLADYEDRGVLTIQNFIIAVKLIALVQNGQKPDVALLKAKVPLPHFEDINIETAYIIADDDREKYKKIFSRLEHGNGLVDGDKARECFLRSKLSSTTLFQIWDLADTKHRGRLDINEFIIAMHLIKQYMAKNIREIPQTLPSGFYELAANVNLDASSPSLFPGNLSSPSSTPRSEMSPAVKNPTLNPDGFNTKYAFIEDSWDVTHQDKTEYDKIFDSIDQMKRGFLTGSEAAKFLVESNLNQDTLATIWSLSDIDKTGCLNREKFAVTMYLIQKTLNGFPLPTTLPTSLIPPSMRHTTDNQYKAASNFFDLEESSTLGHISKKNNGSTSSSISYYSTENFFDLNDPIDSQNNFISDNVTKEPQMIDPFGDTDIHTEIAIESSEIKNYEPQIDIHIPYDSYSTRNSSYSTTSVFTATDNNNGNINIKCPFAGCHVILDCYEIKNLVKKDLYERYDKLALRKALQQMSDIRWCKNSKCGSAQSHIGSDSEPILTCGDCGTKSCFVHDSLWHEGLTCEQYDEVERIRNEATQTYLEQHTKPCPKCGVRISKDEGCDHMTCKVLECKHEFCWL
nr:11397_t:CDS:10 [Entrophospora candida]